MTYKSKYSKKKKIFKSKKKIFKSKNRKSLKSNSSKKLKTKVYRKKQFGGSDAPNFSYLNSKITKIKASNNSDESKANRITSLLYNAINNLDKNKVEKVEFILNKGSDIINKKPLVIFLSGNSCCGVLIYIITCKHLEATEKSDILKLLIAKLPDDEQLKKQILTHTGYLFTTTLVHAVLTEEPKIVKAIIEHEKISKGLKRDMVRNTRFDKDSPLKHAVKIGNLDIISILLDTSHTAKSNDKYIKPHLEDEDGNNALMCAVINNKIEFVRKWIGEMKTQNCPFRNKFWFKFSSNLTHKNKEGYTALMLAALINFDPTDDNDSNNVMLVEELMKYTNPDNRKQQQYVSQALMSAVSAIEPKPAVISVLLKDETLDQDDINRALKQGINLYISDYPMDFYLKKGKGLEIIMSLIDHDLSDVNLVYNDDTQNTLLHTAIINGNGTLTELLLAAGAKLNIKNSEGKTPLDYLQSDFNYLDDMVEKERENIKAILKLSEESEESDELNLHKKKLYLLAKYKSTKLLNKLISDIDKSKIQAVFEYIDEVEDRTMLMAAVKNDDIKLVDNLLELDADPNIVSKKDNKSALDLIPSYKTKNNEKIKEILSLKHAQSGSDIESEGMEF